MKKWLFFLSFLFLSLSGYCQIITTIAGGLAGCGGANVPATAAGFAACVSTCIDDSGNVYVADYSCRKISKFNPATNDLFTTVAGNGSSTYNGDGELATLAGLNQPMSVAVDHNGNVYIADNLNNRVRKVDYAGVISTIAGTGSGGYNGDNIPATDASIVPFDISVDTAGNVYVADFDNMRVRKINTDGIITTVAGGGVNSIPPHGILATDAELTFLVGVTADINNNLYLTTYNNVNMPSSPDNRVLKVNASGIIMNFAGQDSAGYAGDGGPATAALLSSPFKTAVDKAGNIYIADAGNNCIRKVDKSGIITTYVGNGMAGYSGDGGSPLICELNFPTGVATDASDNLYIADLGNQRIRYINSSVLVKTPILPISSLNIYPNPNNGVFTITITARRSETADLLIINSLGETVSQIKMQTNRPEQIKLDVPGGIYFIVSIVDNVLYRCKLIII